MAGIDEAIVREYFEMHGFLVRQVRKYQVQSRKKLASEEIDLLLYNPAYRRSTRSPDFLLDSGELAYVQRALVAIKPWHTIQHFTPAKLTSSSAVLAFLEKTVLRTAERFFPEEEADGIPLGPVRELRKILVLPGLPTQEPHRSESIRLLRERGVDGIISFRAMLRDLLGKVETNNNYQKSDILQLLRLLKHYDLVKDPQLELFPGKK